MLARETLLGRLVMCIAGLVRPFRCRMNGLSRRCPAAFLLGMLEFCEVHRAFVFLAHAIEIVGLIVFRALLLSGMTIHAGLGFHPPMREVGEALRVTIETMDLAMIGIAKIGNTDRTATRLRSLGRRRQPIGTGMTSQAS